MGRRNWLFAWTELGAERVGVVQGLLATCSLQGVDPYTYLVDVLQRVGEHPASRVMELTPRVWKTMFANDPLRSDLRPGARSAVRLVGRNQSPTALPRAPAALAAARQLRPCLAAYPAETARPPQLGPPGRAADYLATPADVGVWTWTGVERQPDRQEPWAVLSHRRLLSRLPGRGFPLRRLEAYHANIRKRLVKRPKIYWRDTGLLHSILNVENADALLSQPWVGASWEGYVIQQLLSALETKGTVHNAFHLRTSDQREIDLILELGGERWAIEIKLTSRPRPPRLDNAQPQCRPDRG